MSALVLAGTMVVPGCSGHAPDAPSGLSYPVYIDYQAPAAGSLPPGTIDDASCYHHNAPVNLRVSTSWGGQGRLEPTFSGAYGLLLPDVPVNQVLWIAFVDINLCPTGAINVTRGVSANGTALTRLEDVDGRPSLVFRVDSGGRIVP